MIHVGDTITTVVDVQYPHVFHVRYHSPREYLDIGMAVVQYSTFNDDILKGQ